MQKEYRTIANKRSRIKDSPISCQASDLHPPNHHLRDLLIRNNTNRLHLVPPIARHSGFGYQFPSLLHHIRFPLFPSIPDNRIGIRALDRSNNLLAKSLLGVRRRPEHTHGDFLRKHNRQTGPDATPRSHEHDTLEQRYDPQNAASRDAAHPEPFRGVPDLAFRPISRVTNNEAEALNSWFGYGGKSVPFRQGPLGYADRSARVGIGIAKVQPDGVGRENFGAHRDFAETEPGEDDADGGDNQKIEGRVTGDGFGKGLVSTRGIGAEDGENPEEG